MKRRNTSTLPALTPYSVETSGRESLPQPAVVSDLKVERILYEALQAERQANAALRRAFWDQEKRFEEKFKKFRAAHLSRGVAKNLKVSHNDTPSGRKVQ